MSNIKAFNSGRCEVYSVEKRTIKDKLGTFDYCNETLGITMFTEFQTIGIEIEKVISIPYNEIAQIGRVAKLSDGGIYRISLVQEKDTFPRTLRIALSKNTLGWNTND